MKGRLFQYFRLLTISIVIILCAKVYALDRVPVYLGTEYDLPSDFECVGFKDIFRWFLLSNAALPLVSQDAFSRVKPGLASEWHLDNNKLCFLIDTSRTFSDQQPTTAENIKLGLLTAINMYPDYLNLLHDKISSIHVDNGNKLCVEFSGSAVDILNILALSIAAPVIRNKDKCYYAGDFSIHRDKLVHRPTGRPIFFVSIKNQNDKNKFLNDNKSIRIFHEVQMQAEFSFRSGKPNTLKMIPVRGANRIAFLYAKSMIDETTYMCLQKSLMRISWPYQNGSNAKTFLPPSFYGTKLPFSSEINMTAGKRPESARTVSVASSEMYNNEQTERFLLEWFGQCGLVPNMHYYPKGEFDRRYRNGSINYDMLFNSVGVTYPDPRPSLTEYFIRFEDKIKPLGGASSLYPLVNIAKIRKVLKNENHGNLYGDLVKWEHLIAESRQIISVGHFTPYTIVVGPDDDISCLPECTSNTTALFLGCLMR